MRRKNSLSKAHSIDRRVAKTVARLRKERKLSQTELGKKLRMSQQQIHKYETAQDRIGAGSLWLIAKALKAPLCSFFPKIKKLAV